MPSLSYNKLLERSFKSLENEFSPDFTSAEVARIQGRFDRAKNEWQLIGGKSSLHLCKFSATRVQNIWFEENTKLLKTLQILLDMLQGVVYSSEWYF